MDALKAFLVSLLGLGSSGGISFDQLLSGLLAAGNAPSTGKSAQHAVAQCIAGLCAAAGYEATMRTVTSLLGQLQGSQRSTEVCLLFHAQDSQQTLLALSYHST